MAPKSDSRAVVGRHAAVFAAALKLPLDGGGTTTADLPPLQMCTNPKVDSGVIGEFHREIRKLVDETFNKEY